MSLGLLALLLLPLVGAVATFAVRNQTGKYIAFGAALLQMLITFYIAVDFDATRTVGEAMQHEITYPWSSFFKSTLHFGIDGLTLVMLLLTNVLVPVIIYSAFGRGRGFNHNFYALILLMQFGLVGVFTSLDGLLFYIFWEVTLIPIWLIAGIWGEEKKRFQFTTKFFVYTFAGSLFMLAAFIYVYNYSASFAVLDMYRANLNINQQTVVFWFIFLAFAVKLPIFPFHTWQPDTYTYSPSQGTMLLSGIMLKMAVYGILRYLIPVVPDAAMGISGAIVLALAIIGVLHGALIALIQTDIKRIFAYSSFSHVGLMVAGIFAAVLLANKNVINTEGAEGAVLQAFAHGFNVVGLFIAADVLIRRFGTRDIREMGGLARKAPMFAVLFLVVILGSAAVPLTNGFVGEFMLLKSIFNYNTLAAITAGITIILAAAYLLRAYGKTTFNDGKDEVLAHVGDVDNYEFGSLAVIAGAVLLFGLFPQPIIDLVREPLHHIFSTLK